MKAPRTIEAKLIPCEWIPVRHETPEASSESSPASLAVASEAAQDLTLQLSLASTQLCRELNEMIGQHPDFDTWKRDRRIPPDTLKALWNSLRATSCYQGIPYSEMPERFLRSAWLRIDSIYASWFKIQAKLLSTLFGLNRWLGVVKSDEQLAELCGCAIETIQARAYQLLADAKLRLQEHKQAGKADSQLQPRAAQGKRRSKSVVLGSDNAESVEAGTVPEVAKVDNLMHMLFNIYSELVASHGSLLDQCAIIHLIKNHGQVAAKAENRKEFAAQCQAKRQRAERAEEQLAARLPKVRDLGEASATALADGVQRVSLDNREFAAQLAKLQRQPNPLPYAVLFYSGDDLEWHLLQRRNPNTQVIEERIFVKFKGLKKYLKSQIKQELEKEIEHHLKILGLNRDDLLKWQILKRKNKATQTSEKYISFKLKETSAKFQPQLREHLDQIDLENKYNFQKEYTFEVCCDRLHLQDFQTFLQDWQLYATHQTQYSIGAFAFKSAALTWKQSIKHGIPKLQLYLNCTLDQQELTAEGAALARSAEVPGLKTKIQRYEEQQKNGIVLTETQQKDLKKTNSQLTALTHPYPRPAKPPDQSNPNIIAGIYFTREAVVAVAVVDCSTQTVLAYRTVRQLLGQDYKQLAAYRLAQRKNANERHKQQRRGKVSTLSESKRGRQLDRVIAKRIVAVAQEFKASSLAMPDLTDLREHLQAELEAKAVWKYPGDRAKQQEYKKQYKINLHNWSYRRLRKAIQARADKVGVSVEQGQALEQGELQEKAVHIAVSAYRARKTTSP